jgi:rubrerythrin
MTLTPTKLDGATGQASDVLYVDPACVVTTGDLDAQMHVEGLNTPFLADTLSAFLTHERCGRHLYRSVASRTENPMLKARYEEFGRETELHVEILENLITEMGGNPNYVSPMARAVEAKDSRLVEAITMPIGTLDLMTLEMAMLDAVFIAESVDHANWQAMATIAAALPEGPIKESLTTAVTEVEAQEDDHLQWAASTRMRLMSLQLQSSLLQGAALKMEEMLATVRGWLSD